MTEPKNKKNISNKQLLIQYASIGSQLFAGLIITVFLGKWIDEKLHFSFPVFIWLLPLIFIVGMILKVINDTSRKKNE
ncbi:MAG: AtpZ/AtpI family protein [Parafilimonas sp.]